jgi:pimeloyl-ACP methyl ester carboxylesterase
MPHVTSGGVRIYWEEEGPEGQEGQERQEAVLLIMGLGATLEWWHRLRPAIAARFRAILFDNRGVGRSGVPPPPYSIAQMADDAAAVLDAAGVASAHVVGASMGGYIAQELVLRHPARARSLVLGCTSCGGRDAVVADAEVRAALDARATMPREDAMWLMAPYTFDAATPPEVIANELAMRLATNVTNDGFFAQLQAIRDWGGTLARLNEIAVPTLVIHGETDRLVPPQNARILAGAIPGARLVMLPHASHIFFADQLEPSRDALLSFLSGAATTKTRTHEERTKNSFSREK